MASKINKGEILAKFFDDGEYTALFADGAVSAACGYAAGQQAYAVYQNGEAVTVKDVEKNIKVLEMAAQTGCPVVTFYNSVGAKLAEGLDVLTASAKLNAQIAKVSGVIPQVAVVLGVCGGTSRRTSATYPTRRPSCSTGAATRSPRNMPAPGNAGDHPVTQPALHPGRRQFRRRGSELDRRAQFRHRVPADPQQVGVRTASAEDPLQHDRPVHQGSHLRRWCAGLQRRGDIGGTPLASGCVARVRSWQQPGEGVQRKPPSDAPGRSPGLRASTGWPACPTPSPCGGRLLRRQPVDASRALRRSDVRPVFLQPVGVGRGQHPGGLLFTQLQGGMVGPVGVGQVGAADHNEIHQPVGKHPVGRRRGVDAPR